MGVYGTPSGTTTYNPIGTEIALDVLERVDIRASAVTTDHMTSLRRSCNLVNSRWSNRGVNLWRVDPSPTPITMPQGVQTYSLPADTVDMLDTYLRLYQMQGPVNEAVSVSTQIGSPLVTVGIPSSGLLAGQYLNIILPIAVGGLVLLGFYPVQSVPDTNDVTITAAGNATASVTAGGQVPVFTTTPNSSSVSVQLPAHGFSSGQAFQVQILTGVGGVQLLGAYTVATVTDANNFVITASNIAGFGQTLAENGGLAQYAAQQQGAQGYTDILLYPLSRADYAAIPNKADQGRPTTYRFDRQISPNFNIWPLPDGNGPYQIQSYLLHQIQDVNLQGGQTLDLPFRMLYAFIADAAKDMAIKWAPAKFEALKQEAAEAWDEASSEDREKVSTFISPDLGGYFT